MSLVTFSIVDDTFSAHRFYPFLSMESNGTNDQRQYSAEPKLFRSAFNKSDTHDQPNKNDPDVFFCASDLQ